MWFLSSDFLLLGLMEGRRSRTSILFSFRKNWIQKATSYKLQAINHPYPLPTNPFTLYTISMTITFNDEKQNATLAELRKNEEEDLVKVLSDKYNLPYVDLRGLAPEPDAMMFVQEEEARAAEIAPFKLDRKSVV